MSLPSNIQMDAYDCGPTCLKNVAEFYGKKIDLEYLREHSYITRNGVSLLGISQAAEKLGFRTLMLKLDLQTLQTECSLPAILHWNQQHFVVLYDIVQKRPFLNFQRSASEKFVVADPGHGIINLSKGDFEKYWQSSGADKGVALLLEPTSEFYSQSDTLSAGGGMGLLLKYLKPFKRQLLILTAYMVLSTLITISFPYLTKGLVDKGVLSRNGGFVLLFAVSQLVLFLSGTTLDILRSWLLLHINAKISLNIISDFLKKLLRLPIKFFDTKSVGDVSQRINDHHRIETFLTGDLINTAFSLVNVIVFTFILLYYQLSIWLVFVIVSTLGILWLLLFRKKRKQLDYIRFSRSKNSQEKLFELVVGMQEIKLNGSEDSKRWEWEFLQQRLHKLNIKGLKLDQFQQTGFIFLTQLKNIIISYLAAIYVMHDQMTFGTMLSISYIIGQTNGPLDQLNRFFRSSQDAKLSLNRLQEVHNKDDEEPQDTPVAAGLPPERAEEILNGSQITLENVSFQYQGPRSPYVLKNIDLTLNSGEVTAIIGASGSGKTTLMKLLLGFYQPVEGRIIVGNRDLRDISPRYWRSKCGSVMQDGYIFYDTISTNIALDGNEVDMKKMRNAISISNVDEFVRGLPMNYKTCIGSSGLGLSGGQKQRILIARAVYKDPEFIFFDEATSSLDANNERLIMHKLNTFFMGKTVLVIAHRLSTVRNADKIVVLEKGEVVEMGTHESLSRRKGKYFELVKNQLELGD